MQWLNHEKLHVNYLNGTFPEKKYDAEKYARKYASDDIKRPPETQVY